MTPAEIKSIRIALGLSQRAMAERLGTTQATVCRIENGEFSPGGPTQVLLRMMMDQIRSVSQGGIAVK